MPGHAGAAADPAGGVPGAGEGIAAGKRTGESGARRSPGDGNAGVVAAPLETTVTGTPGAPRSRTRMLTSSIRASPMPVRAKVTVSGSPEASAGTIR